MIAPGDLIEIKSAIAGWNVMSKFDPTMSYLFRPSVHVNSGEVGIAVSIVLVERYVGGPADPFYYVVLPGCIGWLGVLAVEKLARER